MSTGEQTTRTYSSPLRESQASRTRELILDALTELLGARRADEVSTAQIAERAGVSQPTVYRHFPDRAALVDGLADRVDAMAAAHDGSNTPLTIEDWAAAAEASFHAADEHSVESTAEAVLNADPRRFSRSSRRRSDEIAQSVARSLPELNDRDQRRLTALLRNLISIQAWLRMREEFGMDGAESGALVGWAIRTLLQEVRNGRLPEPPTPAPPVVAPGGQGDEDQLEHTGSTGLPGR